MTAAVASIEVGAVLSAPGRTSAAGPARIHFKHGKIAAIEPLEFVDRRTLAIAAPSNAHDHGRGLRTLAFGAVDDALEAWLPTLGREPRVKAYHRAAVAFVRMAEGGIAATNHTHGPQNEAKILEETEEVSNAARDVGIHVAFAAPFRDRNPLVYGDQPAFIAAADPSIRRALEARLTPVKSVADFLRSVDEMTQFEHATFSIQYCPVGAQWVSDASLAAIAEASANNGRRVHMHLLETRYQREWADHAYPQGFVRHLDALGLLSPRLSVAHGVYLREDECAQLAMRGVIVSVNTSSNFRLRSGIAPVATFLRTGLQFGIGLDALPLDDDDDILREMRLVWLNHRGFGLKEALSAEQLFRAATIEGRRAIIGEDGGGTLAVGAPADVLVFDLDRMAPDVLSQSADPTTLLLTRATRHHISHLIVGGRTIVENGRCTSVDRAALEADLLLQARAAWARSPPDDGATAHIKRAVHHYYGCGCHSG
jgi:cytosine/adenosine deaminase-related metal-dependent hydrolase